MATNSRSKKVPAKSKTGPQIIDGMQADDKVTLDRFYDRNPWTGGRAAQDKYLRAVVERNRRERALFMQKEASK